MAEVLHRAFVHQQNGIIFISDGEQEILFSSAQEFALEEPFYCLPENAVSQSYEHSYLILLGDNTVVEGAKPNEDIERYIDSVSKYKENQAWQFHPLSKATTVEEAQKIAILEVNRHAYSILKLTDWYALRELTTGKYVPTEVRAHRKQVVLDSNQRTQKVNNMTTLAEIREYLDHEAYQNWSSLPEKNYRY